MSIATPERLGDVIERIRPVDEAAGREARRRWDTVAMPLGGLGLLQESICRIAAARRSADVRFSKRALAVFCADNGVVARGVSQSGQDVTAIVARNLCDGATSSCSMAACARCDVHVVDVGMAYPLHDARIEARACVRGTADITRGPAMTRQQALAALGHGSAVALELARAGNTLLLGGEMGIGNTTTSAAMACVLLDENPEALVGRGAGLDMPSLMRKRAVVRSAIACNEPDAGDALDVLCKLGGLDIAALAGFYLGAAAAQVPVVLDGVISDVAALVARMLCPAAGGYMLASHVSAEPAAAKLLDRLGLDAPLHAGLHLGEGTGALALVPLLDMALAVYEGGRSFSESGMDAYEELV